MVAFCFSNYWADLGRLNIGVQFTNKFDHEEDNNGEGDDNDMFYNWW